MNTSNQIFLYNFLGRGHSPLTDPFFSGEGTPPPHTPPHWRLRRLEPRVFCSAPSSQNPKYTTGYRDPDNVTAKRGKRQKKWQVCSFSVWIERRQVENVELMCSVCCSCERLNQQPTDHSHKMHRSELGARDRRTDTRRLPHTTRLALITSELHRLFAYRGRISFFYSTFTLFTFTDYWNNWFQCFDTVGWAARRASGL